MPTIAEIKEQTTLHTPLVLFECTLPDGSVERWSTHRAQVNGTTFEARVLGHSLFDIRSGSDEAIDTVSRVAVTLANADSYFSQISLVQGWKGARVSASFLFYDLTNGTPASEGMVLFRGFVNPPDEITEAEVRLSMTNRLSLQRVVMPQVRIQRRCPWTFPTTLAQRQESIDGGAKGKYSRFYACGYSADLPGGVGTLGGAESYVTCDYTREQCIERGMFDKDAQGRDTRRFGGIEYVPATTLVRGHGEAGLHTATVLDNEARYNDFAPLVYGTAWTQPPVVTARNDGNLTRMEVLLGLGEINGVLKVVVNDVEVPAGTTGMDMTATGWYNLVSTGSAIGAFNFDFSDQTGKPLGDPYGGLAYMSVVVPNRISEGKALPKIQVLMEGLKLPIYTAAGEYAGESFSHNPAWILLDILRRSGWEMNELEIGSFAAAAAYCDEAVPARDLYGNAVLIPRYGCNLAVRRRRSAADLVRGVRNNAGLFLSYAATGRLELRVEEKLALQQPAKPSGSNATTDLDGGWPAYEFGDGSQGFSGIARRENGDSSVRLWCRSAAESPNRYAVEFQDEFNEYQQDSLSLVDTDDAIRSGQEVSTVLPALGIPNFHQATRLIRRQLDKCLQGNLFIQFETSVRGVGLRPGDLITVTYLKEGFLRQPFRIQRIAPGVNHRTAVIEAQIHDDSWYTDDATEGGAVARRQGRWGTGVPRPLVGSVLDENQHPQFGIEEVYQERNDGTVAVFLRASFNPPAQPKMVAVQIPHLSLAPAVETTGGTLAGGQRLYYAVSALDQASGEGQLSFVVRADIPTGTNTNSVRLEGLRFSSASSSFHVYRGPNPSQLYRIASELALAASFTDTGFDYTLAGPPDENYDHAKFDWRLELHPEVAATDYSESTIGSSALHLLPDEFAGMVVRITDGTGTGQERVIASHDSNLLTLTTRWELVPDFSSKFVIAESSWNFGSTGASSPVQFEVPNRGGATVHISGVAVNARGVESSRALSPVTRWQIGGSEGGGFDPDVPPPPVFGIAPTLPGSVEIVGIGFPDLTNTNTIRAGTLTMHYWDELQSSPSLALAAPIDALTTMIELSGGTAQVGDLLQIDSEVVEVEVAGAGQGYTVRRGSHNTTANSHEPLAIVYNLSRKVYIIPFPRSFFGSPASGSFSYRIELPDVRLAAAEMFMSNDRGNGETGKVSVTATVDQGLRTYSGGQFTIQVEGHLAIQTAAAPPLVVERTHSIRDVFAVVREAPTGLPIELALRQDDEVLCTLSIPAGATSSDFVNGFGLPPLQAMSRLTLDIISVGQSSTATPGKDLTVTIRL